MNWCDFDWKHSESTDSTDKFDTEFAVMNTSSHLSENCLSQSQNTHWMRSTVYTEETVSEYQSMNLYEQHFYNRFITSLSLNTQTVMLYKSLLLMNTFDWT